MLSTNLSRFSGLILVLIITVTSATGAYALADATSSATADAPQASVDASNEQLVGETWRRTELYFGTGKPDGSAVTSQEFEDFVDEIVTPRFPDGLTLLTGDANGATQLGLSSRKNQTC